MKKLINAPDDVVAESLRGLAAAQPGLRVDVERRIVTRASGPVPGKVALVSGGGSGHEPLHTGLVGLGCLDAACPGEVFTSPVPDQIAAAATAAHGGAGVLLIVKNYTGDVLNFRMAAELLEDEGVAVETVLVDDDVAVEDSSFTAGRRGTGATLLVERLAGALAEQGAPLAEVAALAREVDERSRSFAIALTAVTSPATGRPGYDLPDDEIEVGVGIHGEPGTRRAPIAPARDLVRTAVDAILTDRPVPSGTRVLALLSGLGGTPLLELNLAYGEVAAALGEHGVTVARALVGNYVTSLDAAGFSLTLCPVEEPHISLWDAPLDTPALRWKA